MWRNNVDARLSNKIDPLSAQMGHMRGALVAEIPTVEVGVRLAALEARRA